MLSIQEESWATLWPALEPIWRLEHAPELVPHPEITPALDVQAYTQLEAEGLLCCLTARWTEEGRTALVGYHLSRQQPFLNAAGMRTQISLLFYIRPLYRRQGIGRQLFVAWEHAMQARGVQLLFTVTKMAEGKSHPRFFDHLGYVANELVLSKWIGAPAPEREVSHG